MSTPTINVLLIEDNPDVARSIRQILQSQRGNAFLLEDADRLDAGLECLRADRRDAVLLDLSLPDSTGLGALTRVRACAPHTPIIVMTDLDDEALALQATEQGAQDYVIKGQADGNTLARVIRYAVERKQGEGLLRASEERFRALVEHSHDAVTFLAADGTVLYDSPSISRLLGFTPMERIGRSVFEFVHPAERPRMAQGYVEFVQQPGAVAPSEARFLHKDGMIRCIEGVRTNLLHEPAVRAVVVNYRDVTERKRAEAEILRRNQELATLNQIGQTLGKLATPTEILETIFAMVGRVLDNRNLYIALYDEGSHSITFPVYTIDGERVTRAGRPFGDGVTEYVIRTRTPLFLPRDFQAGVGARGIAPRGKPARCFLAVPLASGGKVVGVLALQDYEREDAYDEHHLELLTMIAAQAAVALENARLLAETQCRAFELDALNQIANAASHSLNLDDSLNNVLDELTQTLRLPKAWIYLLDPQTNTLTVRAERGWDRTLSEHNVLRLGEGFSGRVAQAGQPRSANLEGADISTRDKLLETGYRAIAAVPLVTEGRVIGVLGVASETRDRFDQSAMRWLGAAGNTIAAALDNARLFAQTQQDLARTQSLHELSTQILSAQTVADTGETIVRQIVRTAGIHSASIRLLDPQGQVTFETGMGAHGGPYSHAPPRPNGATMRVWQTGEPLIVSGQDPESGLISPAAAAMGIQSLIGLPLKAEQRVLGVLFLHYPAPRAFSTEEIRSFGIYANQAAIALERARLFHQAQRRLTELEAVNTISTALRSATTLDEMLPRFLDETLKLFETDSGFLSLYDPESNALHRAVVRGFRANLAPVPIHPCEGIVGHVFATGEAYCTRQVMSDPHALEATRASYPPGWGGACVPIRAAAEVIGVLFVSVSLPRTITHDEMRLLVTLAEIAGTAIHRTRLHTQTEQAVQRLTALRTIDNAINASLDLRVTLNVVLGQIKTQLGVDAASVLLLNPHMQTLEPAASQGFRSPRTEKIYLRLNEGLAGRAVLERRTVLIADLPGEGARQTRAAALAADGFVAYGGTPLLSKGVVKGVLEIFQRAPLAPNAEWKNLLETLAGQVAIAIDNAELFETLQRTNSDLALAYDATIEGWSRALDLRDRETEGHTQRVTEQTLRLARALNVPEAHLVQIHRGALLHDIGKVGIPDNILHKPGPLTAAEWEVMRQHPVYAHDLLASITYLRPAIEIPYCHHEKWNGTGYPRGLQGEEIPLAARIFAIVDVWDALSSNRPYRNAWTAARVREHLHAESGKHFDPRVVDTFLEMITANGELSSGAA